MSVEQEMEWLKLCELVAKEPDPERLRELTDLLVKALDAREQKIVKAELGDDYRRKENGPVCSVASNRAIGRLRRAGLVSSESNTNADAQASAALDVLVA
jgi:hypothetical protein